MFSLGAVSDSASAQSALAVGTSGSPVGSLSLGFGVSASYSNMLAFLQDLEHSLRVMDVEKITFTAGGQRYRRLYFQPAHVLAPLISIYAIS